MHSILAVEDDANTRMLLEHILGSEFNVQLAGSVGEALNALRTDHFDLILVDIHLGPGTSGDVLLLEAKEMPEYNRTPIVALTAYALPGDQKRFLSMGFDAYISKPFTRAQLKDTILTLLAR